jgi:hypothetical protein
LGTDQLYLRNIKVQHDAKNGRHLPTLNLLTSYQHVP